jgi:hypothetical protein
VLRFSHEIEAAAKRLDALLHSGQPEAETCCFVHSVTIIRDLDGDAVRLRTIGWY